MKKYNFLIGLTLLIVSIILSNIFNENTITKKKAMSYPKVLFLAINLTLSKNKEMMNFGRK